MPCRGSRQNAAAGSEEASGYEHRDRARPPELYQVNLPHASVDVGPTTSWYIIVTCPSPLYPASPLKSESGIIWNTLFVTLAILEMYMALSRFDIRYTIAQ